MNTYTVTLTISAAGTPERRTITADKYAIEDNFVHFIVFPDKEAGISGGEVLSIPSNRIILIERKSDPASVVAPEEGRQGEERQAKESNVAPD